MRRHITIGCALAAGTLFFAACSSNSVPPTSGGPGLFAQSRISPAATNVLKNSCFSTGKLSPWKEISTKRGEAVISKKQTWDCPYSAFMGTTAPPAVNGTFGIEQSVKIPAKAKLTWWYYADTNDEPKFASQLVELTTSTGKVVDTCFKELYKTKTWTQGTCDLSKYAGKTYDVTLAVKDNGYSKTFVYWYVDDLSLE